MESRFLVESTTIENVKHFKIKLPCQKPMLRKIEWETRNAQDGPIIKSGVLPLTTSFFFFLELNLSVRVSHE